MYSFYECVCLFIYQQFLFRFRLFINKDDEVPQKSLERILRKISDIPQYVPYIASFHLVLIC